MGAWAETRRGPPGRAASSVASPPSPVHRPVGVLEEGPGELLEPGAVAKRLALSTYVDMLVALHERFEEIRLAVQLRQRLGLREPSGDIFVYEAVRVLGVALRRGELGRQRLTQAVHHDRGGECAHVADVLLLVSRCK